MHLLIDLLNLSMVVSLFSLLLVNLLYIVESNIMFVCLHLVIILPF